MEVELPPRHGRQMLQDHQNPTAAELLRPLSSETFSEMKQGCTRHHSAMFVKAPVWHCRSAPLGFNYSTRSAARAPPLSGYHWPWSFVWNLRLLSCALHPDETLLSVTQGEGSPEGSRQVCRTMTTSSSSSVGGMISHRDATQSGLSLAPCRLPTFRILMAGCR